MSAVSNALKSLQWRWLLTSVVVPILGPTILSLVVVGMWKSGNPAFTVDWSVLVDLSPWALAFYALTLIGSSFNAMWGQISRHPALTTCLIIIGALVLLYAGLNAVWRLNRPFVPPAPVYYVTGVLLASAVVVCHWSYLVQSRAATTAALMAPAPAAPAPAAPAPAAPAPAAPAPAAPAAKTPRN
jgi:cation transport ATPase